MAVQWRIDPVSQGAANVPLLLVEAGDTGYRLTGMDLTPPPSVSQYASSADTEGDVPTGPGKPSNRIVALEYLVMGGTDASLEAKMSTLTAKIEKLRRERGTLEFQTLTGDLLFGDVYNAAFREMTLDRRYVRNRVIPIRLEFECAPYFRATPVTLSDHVETTNPVLVFTETGLAGDAPGLATLVIDEDQALSQWEVVWGIQSQYYDAAASAALFYEAVNLTPLGSATLGAGSSGAFGGGANKSVTAGSQDEWTAMLSSQAAGGGAHWTHIGSYRVFARVQGSGAHTEVRLQWGLGDLLRYTLNDVQLAWGHPTVGNGWTIVDLGLVHIPPGTPRWESRILIKQPGNQLEVNYLWLVPVDEGSGHATGIPRIAVPTSFSALDTFDVPQANLAGSTMDVGGTWTGAGDTDDYIMTTNYTPYRTAVSDGGAFANARFELAGTATPTGVFVSAIFGTDTFANSSLTLGLLARYVDTANFMIAFITPTVAGQVQLSASGRLAGGSLFTSPGPDSRVITPADVDTITVGGHVISTASWVFGMRMALWADITGRVFIWLRHPSVPFSAYGTPDMFVQAASLATGGALASGKVGLFDYNPAATACTRYVAGFQAAPTPDDAAMFASQSIRWGWDGVQREDSAGVLFAPVSYEGDNLYPPPSGNEGRTLRTIVKATRNPMGYAYDRSTDDISARMTYTPRYLVLS
jgi:hypothetical protein